MVDPLTGIEHYPDIIKHPMDLGTIKQRYASGHYASAEAFAADVRLARGGAKPAQQHPNGPHCGRPAGKWRWVSLVAD